MLKRSARFLSRSFSTDDDSIDRVTAKDAFIGLPLLMTVLWFVSLPLYPLFFLFQLFEFAAAVCFLVCVFVFPITGYLIVTDGATLWRVLLCFASGFVLFGYFVLYPLYLRRHGLSRRRRGLSSR